MGKWVHRLTEINKNTKLGVCSNCGVVRLYFDKTNNRFKCYEAKKEHKGKGNPRGPHGLTLKEATEIKLKIGSCEICGETAISKLRIDHDHADESLRGVLCNTCNVGLGMFKDKIELLAKAITYLSG